MGQGGISMINRKVIKRNGEEVEFNLEKIRNAIKGANNDVNESDRLSDKQITMILFDILSDIDKLIRAISVEEIQDMVEDSLLRHCHYEVAKAYIRYRYEHKLLRESPLDKKLLAIVDYKSEEVKQENANKDPEIIPTQRDYIAGEISRDITNRKLLPKKIVDAHKAGIIHFHDSDYFIQHEHNCCLINLDDMLQNGTVISGTYIDKPHKFSTACTIATQIIAQVASSQYGGQSISLAHLAKFVNETRKKAQVKYSKLYGVLQKKEINKLIEDDDLDDIRSGVQTIQYQVITLMTTNGQAPFITMYMNINEASSKREQADLALCIREVLNQRILGVKNEKGIYITPAFPKLIYVLDDNNIKESSEYWDLTVLAAKCTAKRMVPDYISNKVQKKIKEGAQYPCMGCRSFLTVDRTAENYSKCKNWEKGNKYYGRFNQGVVTISLPDVALSSGGDKDKFWDILDDRLENLCYPALMARHERLKGTPSDVAPILWQYGALARLEKGEKIDELLYHGYSTISLGYAGLYECVKYMTGESHTGKGKDFGLDVMKRLNDYCEKWKERTDIDFSIYGTPIESTTYKFAKCLQKRFGIIKGIIDRNYITNSYHVPVFEKIDAFNKLSFESEFQKLSPGGAISYVEIPNLTNNIDAVLMLIIFIYDHIMYAELNTKCDYCQVCGYEHEILIVPDGDKLVWECPNCGNRDRNKMNIARRTCGYIGVNDFNQGRTQEIKERVLHL